MNNPTHLPSLARGLRFAALMTFLSTSACASRSVLVAQDPRPAPAVVVHSAESSQHSQAKTDAPVHTRMGLLSKAEIMKVVKAAHHDAKQCYDAELANSPKLGGRMMFQFIIAPDGSVDRARLRESNFENKNMESCILALMTAWTFPKPRGNGSVEVNYPYVFRTE